MTKSKYLNLHIITINKEVKKKLVNLEEKGYLIKNISSNKAPVNNVGHTCTTIKNKERYYKVIGLKEYEREMVHHIMVKKLIESKKISWYLLQRSFINIIKVCIKVVKKNG